MVSTFFKQSWAVSGVLLNMLGQGMVLSYPSVLLPALKAQDAAIKTDLDTASWIASLVGLASIPGFLASSFLMEVCGRRMAHALLIVPGTLGWVLIYLAKDVPTLMIGRFLGGITVGATVTLGAVVIGEYTSPQLRGMFLNLMEVCGRRMAHALLIVPGTLGWVLIYLAKDVPTLMIGRFLGGITVGATVTLGAVVIGEYTSPQLRGMFLNLKTAAVCLGNTVVHILGHYFHWQTVAIFGIAPHVVAFLIVCTWPESPSWLASRQKHNQSEKAWLWLRGDGIDSKTEFDSIIRAQKKRQAEAPQKTSLKGHVVEFFKKFTKKDFLKPLLIMVLAGVLLETCGRHIFPAYALQIIEEITGDKSQSFFYTLIIDVITTFSSGFSSVLVGMLKRRTLLFISGGAALVVLTGICTCLYLTSLGIISKWLPIGMFMLYFILANLGCTPIPLALLGEVFPVAHRGAGSAMSGLVLSMWLMVALKITPAMLVSVKVYGTFAIYGSAMAATLVALYFTLPETKDRTLQEIEYFFNHGKFADEKVRGDEENLKMLKS